MRTLITFAVIGIVAGMIFVSDRAEAHWRTGPLLVRCPCYFPPEPVPRYDWPVCGWRPGWDGEWFRDCYWVR